MARTETHTVAFESGKWNDPKHYQVDLTFVPIEKKYDFDTQSYEIRVNGRNGFLLGKVEARESTAFTSARGESCGNPAGWVGHVAYSLVSVEERGTGLSRFDGRSLVEKTRKRAAADVARMAFNLDAAQALRDACTEIDISRYFDLR